MEYKVGDNVRITKRDGEGKTGVITKISDVDPKFKYCVKTQYDEFWKEARSIELLYPETTPPREWVEPNHESEKVLVEPQKKRGRPKGAIAKAKKAPAKTKKAPAKEIQNVEIMARDEILTRYREFISMLSLSEFLEVHSLINQDYADVCSLIKERVGLRGVE